jgi:hypothetical protein
MGFGRKVYTVLHKSPSGVVTFPQKVAAHTGLGNHLASEAELKHFGQIHTALKGARHGAKFTHSIKSKNGHTKQATYVKEVIRTGTPKTGESTIVRYARVGHHETKH